MVEEAAKVAIPAEETIKLKKEVKHMLRWALAFLIISIVAALFGFGGIASSAVGIAKVLFFIFIVLFAISLVVGLISGKKTNIS